MSALSPGLDNALTQERALIAMLIRAELPGHTMRLLVGGAGAISWGSDVYSDVDPIFGTIAAMDSFEDGAGDEAPDWSFSMYPPSNSTAAQLCSPTYQEAPVYVYLAAFSPFTGLLIPDPYLYQSFLWDVGTLMPDRQKREVDIQCVSMFERLLEDDEGARLSDAFHQSIHPGETGFANVTGNERDIYWGLATPPAGAVVTGYGYAGVDGGFDR
ncbi:hypothetical protein [Sphingomonas nostoxanthinifaciens]|uniref:hypothetical protein n=1 Tax=Sphingomonas nostoxanthinifaciens TaxID=2872652 RepID=UPI001CC20AB5|nr:hypothetical protein [Sphingomonas nostoxanthinifaciens]UAK24179.1 hypothetical protein K8P63_17910 [Sphingomonas nostoxanthinifaciens]